MKKLLYFASDFKIGLSTLLTDQLISIYESGINVCAVAGENQQELTNTDRILDKRIPLIRIPGLDAHENFRNLVKRIRQIIVEKDIDIVHVQNNWQLAICACAKLTLVFAKKIQIIYTIHGFRNNIKYKSILAQCIIGTGLFFFSDYVICMSEYLKSKFKFLSYKIKLIPLGISDGFFTEEFMEPRISALNIVFPAQFRSGKNQDLIIRSFAKYIDRTGDYSSTLTLPGGGESLDEMKRLAIELGIPKNVIFPGLISRDDVRQLYLDCNIAVVASNSETFGQSIVEPYVLGRCVITTPVGIAPEIIVGGINGYIFRTEKDLTELFCGISENKSELIKMGYNNYRNREKFSWQFITQLYSKVLKLK